MKVVLKAAEITTIPFRIEEGLRTLAKQKENVRRGVSWTLNSRHLTGHAVDLVPLVDIDKNGKITTTEMYAWPVYFQLAPIIKEAARLVGVPVEWGGDWRKSKDGPHWQLPFGKYPQTPTQAVHFADALGEGGYDPADHPPTNPETDTSAATKSVMAAAGGVGTSVSVGYDPMANLVEGALQQQYELSSGEVARIVIAVAIIGLTCWYAYKQAKGPAYG